MPATYKDGKLVSNTNVSSGNSSGSKNKGGGAQASEGSGGKGGGKPQIASNKVSGSAYNKDKSYGYYNDQGKYVSALQDMFDGGGMNQSGNYFQGGGAISAMLNAAKVRPAGAARARDDQGNYIVDRADIGFRDINDWFDRGGPQASGGEFQGLGLYSALANLVAGQKGDRTPYAAPTQSLLQTEPKTTNPAPPSGDPITISDIPPAYEYGGNRPMSQNLLQNIPSAYEYGGNRPMVPNSQSLGQVDNVANRQPTITPTSMNEPNPDDMMRQKMISAGYDPTGLGPYEMKLFIDAMGL
jgi:hypothetical protein